MANIATRHERVVLSLDDNFSTGMARAAAASALLNRELNSLSGTSVNSRSIDAVSRDMDKVSKSADRAGPAIDRFSGRLGLIRDIALTIGPAFVPIGAVALPAITGLAAQMGAAALAGGTMLIAFQGIGTALEKVNEAAINPTAESLAAAREELQKLSPVARDFVFQMQEMRPVFDGLRDAAGEGLFPGLSAALQELDVVAPRVEAVLSAIGGATGDIVNDFAGGLSSSRGLEFLDFLRDEVPSALIELGQTMSNFTAGLAELWMAFTPLNRDFSSWMLDASAAFDQWAQGLSQTQGFENFVAYIRENGPKVADALASIGNALVNIVTAAAPLGGPVLQGITAIADLLATIAGSDAGPAIMAAVTAMTLLSRSTKTFGAVSQAAWAQNLKGTNGIIAQAGALKRAGTQTAAGVGLLALSMTDLDEKAGLSNTAMGALVGTMIAPGVGTGVGALVGLFADLSSANNNLVDSLGTLDSAINALDPTQIKSALESVNEEYANQSGYVAALSNSGIPGLGEAYELFAGQSDEVTAAQSAANSALAAAEGRTTSVAGAFHAAGLAGARLAVVAQKQAEALQESRNAARGTAREFVNLGNGLDDAKVSLNDWLRQLERQAEALRNFRKNAEQAAEKGLRQGLIAALQEAGPEGALRMRQLANATQKEIGRANEAWGRGQREVQRYTDAIGGIPPSAKTTVDAETADALRKIGQVRSTLQDLDGDRATTYVETVYTTSGRKFKDVPSGVPQLYTGGYTGPGGMYEPRGIVHAGEVVIPKWLVQRDWNLLKARYGHLPGFSGGGVVGVQRTASPTVNVSAPSAPNVNVGGAAVRVFIDGAEVRAVVRSEQASDNRFSRILEDR